MENKDEQHIFTDTNSIKLTRGQRGNVGWEIKIVGEDVSEILKEIETTDEKLIKKYKEVPIINAEETQNESK